MAAFHLVKPVSWYCIPTHWHGFQGRSENGAIVNVFSWRLLALMSQNVCCEEGPYQARASKFIPSLTPLCFLLWHAKCLQGQNFHSIRKWLGTRVRWTFPLAVIWFNLLYLVTSLNTNTSRVSLSSVYSLVLNVLVEPPWTWHDVNQVLMRMWAQSHMCKGRWMTAECGQSRMWHTHTELMLRSSQSRKSDFPCWNLQLQTTKWQKLGWQNHVFLQVNESTSERFTGQLP